MADRASAPIDPVVLGCAAAAAVGAALAGCQPLLVGWADPLLAGALAAVVTIAGARTGPWALIGAAAVAMGFVGGPGLLFACAAAVATLAAVTIGARSPRAAASATALVVQALVRLHPVGFHGLPSIVAGAAMAVVVLSAPRPKVSPALRRGVVAAAVGIGLVVGLGLAAGAYELAGATHAARAGSDAARLGDTAVARRRFDDAQHRFDRARTVLGGWWMAPARFVPLARQDLRGTVVAAEEGSKIARSAGDVLRTADYQHLRYESGRFDLARLRAMDAPLGRAQAAVASSRRRLRADRAPWTTWPVGDALDHLGRELADADHDLGLARYAVQVAPGLLGGDGPRHYLVVFVTPAELRGSGGFVGSYAELSADGGRLRLLRSGSAGALEQAHPRGAVLTGPRDYLARYGRFDPGGHFRDLTFSPHFPFDAAAIREAYPQLGGSRIDGVISIDPIALAALLEFTGPVPVAGFHRTLDSTNAADFLLRTNYALFPDDKAQTAALSELVRTVFDRLTRGFLPGPRTLGATLGPATRAGRIRLWSPLASEERLYTRLGADGAFPAPQAGHDFLAVSSQNSGNNKLDVYQSRTIRYGVHVDRAGRLRAKVVVTVRNGAPTSGLPRYVIGNRQGDPVGTNRMLLSIHTPHDLVAARLDGVRVGVEHQDEAGFQVYTQVLVVPAGGSVRFELDLSGTLDPRGAYRLDLAPQPLVRRQELVVTVARDGRPTTEAGPVAIVGRDHLDVP